MLFVSKEKYFSRFCSVQQAPTKASVPLHVHKAPVLQVAEVCRISFFFQFAFLTLPNNAGSNQPRGAASGSHDTSLNTSRGVSILFVCHK